MAYRGATIAAATRSMGGSSSKLTPVFGMLPSSAWLGAIHDHTSSKLTVAGDHDSFVAPLAKRLAFGVLANHPAVLGE